MIHDTELIDRLGTFPEESFSGRVFRATGVSSPPTAASANGGRWSPVDVNALYTSLDRDGALAEVSSYLALLTPLPRKPLRLHEIETTARRTIRLLRANLTSLGVAIDEYGKRDYSTTQKIGAALAFLEFDGLISPSARWQCDNLTIFADNHGFDSRLEVISSEDVDWQAWARANGIIEAG